MLVWSLADLFQFQWWSLLMYSRPIKTVIMMLTCTHLNVHNQVISLYMNLMQPTHDAADHKQIGASVIQQEMIGYERGTRSSAFENSMWG